MEECHELTGLKRCISSYGSCREWRRPCHLCLQMSTADEVECTKDFLCLFHNRTAIKFNSISSYLVAG